MLTLDLALVTHGPNGLERVAQMLLDPIEGMRYVVSWQNHGNAPIPAALQRPDVEVLRLDCVGQSFNRNNAIAHCSADIILHADDDLTYFPDGLMALRRTFEENPELDVATFRSLHEPMERFPEVEMPLHRRLPKNYSVACFEIAFRRKTAGHLRCCPELGLGSPRFHGGEDEAFLLAAIRRGLNCRYFPITICAHPHPSTGSKQNPTAQNLMAAGVVIALTYPATAMLRVPLKAWRLWRSGRSPFFKSLRCVSSGALAAPGVLRRNHETLW